MSYFTFIANSARHVPLATFLFLSQILITDVSAEAIPDTELAIVNGVPLESDRFPALTALLTGRQAYLHVNGTLGYAKFFGHGLHGAFAGDLVDCGNASEICQFVAGKVCLIEFQFADQVAGAPISSVEQLKNCSLGGGVGAVFTAEENVPGRTDFYNGVADIPAVFVSDIWTAELLSPTNSSEAYTTQIEVVPRVSETILCGATYIGNQWAVTAAHCLTEDTPEGVRVLLPWEVQASVGAYDLHQDQRLVQSVTEIVLADYQRFGIGNRNDIALLKLAEEPTVEFGNLSISTAVKIASQANTVQHSLQSSAVLALGWGSTSVREPTETFSFQAATSATPLAASLTLTPISECVSEWRDYLEANNFPGYAVNIDDTHLCASEPVYQRDTCQGDSGGPLFFEGTDGVELVGITSFGLGCGSSVGVPSVYTRVAAYAGWIQSVTGIEVARDQNISDSSTSMATLAVTKSVASGSLGLSTVLGLLIILLPGLNNRIVTLSNGNTTQGMKEGECGILSYGLQKVLRGKRCRQE